MMQVESASKSYARCPFGAGIVAGRLNATRGES